MRFFFFFSVLVGTFLKVFAQSPNWPSNIIYNSQSTVFFVDKNSRELKVYEPGSKPQLRVIEQADIGKNQGDKQKENDHRTPEGIYFLEKKLSPPEIPFDLYGSLAFTSNYPNYFDRFLGKTGNGIWLHAVPDTIPLTRGSRGCVVVKDQAIKSLSNLVQLGDSSLVIVPEALYLSDDKMELQKKEILSFFEAWRENWEKQSLETYLEAYHESFHGGGMNKKLWSQHKTKLKNQYTNIKIELEPLLILKFGDQVVARFDQTYKSDQYEDKGIKTIYAFWSSDQKIKILREDFKVAQNNINN